MTQNSKSTSPLSSADEELIDRARQVVTDQYEHGRHYVGAAVQTTEEAVYTAVHIEANVGRASVCAEPIALGKAISEGEKSIETLVSVRHPGPNEADRTINIVSPCGVCRELISDLGSDINVIMSIDGDLEKIQAAELLPGKYRESYRRKYGNR